VTLSIEDRLEIAQLLVRVDNAASDRDVAGYVSFFTEEAVMDGEKGEFHGRQAISEAVGPVWASEGDMTMHLTLNTVIEESVDTTTEVEAKTRLLIVSQGQPPVILNVSTITHRVVKVEDGWRVARRTVGTA
jgi:ketosteroid isomerase-like protein